jgi:cold shock CspA family protein
MKTEGKLCYWNSRKFYGIVEVRTREGAGYRLDKYFLHQSAVDFLGVEEPQEGDVVRFSIRASRKKSADSLPCAVDAEIFASAEQMKTVDAGRERTVFEKGGEGRVS